MLIRIPYPDGVAPSAPQILLHSEELTDAYWTPVGTFTANTGAGPDGSMTADRLAASGGIGAFHKMALITLTPGMHRISCFGRRVTAGQQPYFQMNTNDAANTFGAGVQYFNADTSSPSTTQDLVGAPVMFSDPTFENLSGGLFRFSVAFYGRNPSDLYVGHCDATGDRAATDGRSMEFVGINLTDGTPLYPYVRTTT